MRPSLPDFRLTLAACVLLAVPALGPAHAQSAAEKAKDFCMGRASSLDDRIAGCTALIDAKTETGRTLAIALCNRGYVLTERKQYERALIDLDAGIKVDPTYACLFSNRGRAFGFLNELDKAIADYDEAIRLNPNFALAYNNRGDAWRLKGDLERAIADFGAAIRIDTKFAHAYGNRGFAYFKKGDYRRAIDDFNAEIALRPTVDAFIDRGNAYRSLDDLDRAMADYGVVADNAPQDARGWRNRGLVRLMKNDAAGAIAD